MCGMGNIISVMDLTVCVDIFHLDNIFLYKSYLSTNINRFTPSDALSIYTPIRYFRANPDVFNLLPLYALLPNLLLYRYTNLTRSKLAVENIVFCKYSTHRLNKHLVLLNFFQKLLISCYSHLYVIFPSPLAIYLM